MHSIYIASRVSIAGSLYDETEPWITLASSMRTVDQLEEPPLNETTLPRWLNEQGIAYHFEWQHFSETVSYQSHRNERYTEDRVTVKYYVVLYRKEDVVKVVLFFDNLKIEEVGFKLNMPLPPAYRLGYQGHA